MTNKEMEKQIKKIWGVSLKKERTYKYNGYTLLDGTKVKGGTVTAKLPNNKKVEKTLSLIQSAIHKTEKRILDEITEAINLKYPITFIEIKGGAEEGGYVVRGKQNSTDISRLSPDEYHMIDFIDGIISKLQNKITHSSQKE